MAASGRDEVRRSRAGVGLRFQRIVLHGQAGCVRFRLLHGLLDQLMPAALAEPRLHAVGQGAILPGGKNSHLAVASSLGIHLAHGRLVRRKLLLNSGAHVAGCPGQIVLGIVQLVLVKVELRLGNFQIVTCGSIGGRWQLNSAPGPDPLSPSACSCATFWESSIASPVGARCCALAWRNAEAKAWFTS